jgi:hypothetical protein
MTFWADNIKFIKDVLDSKYKKIEDALADVSLSKISTKNTSYKISRKYCRSGLLYQSAIGFQFRCLG